MKSLTRWAPALLCLLVVAIAAVWGLHALDASHAAGAIALAAAPAVATTKSLKQILADLTKLQTDYKGKPMPEDVGKQFDDLAKEAKAMQDEADRETQIKNVERFASQVPDPALPDAGDTKGQKGAESDVAGYVSMGTLFTQSEVFRAYAKAGAPSGVTTAPVEIKGLQGRFVPVTREQRKAIETAIRETKSVPVLGTGVIEPQRLAEVVRVTEHDELRLRDLLNVSPTSSNAVDYVRITAVTRAAAAVAESAAKPEAGLSLDTVSTPVRTHAVWMPVTEQQLMDAPQVTNLIDTELLYDLDKYEEEQVMYGSGAGQNFLGICNDGGVVAGRTVAGDTTLDKIRRAMTDVRRNGYAPNGIAIDPLDWEAIVLLKGSDEHYVWAVVTDENGSRIWGLRVVETIAAEEVSANTTEERNIVVGDWLRGATLWDRMQATIAVGWVNDQFIKNQRTIRAERRAAFAVKRPKAFRKILTQASAA